MKIIDTKYVTVNYIIDILKKEKHHKHNLVTYDNDNSVYWETNKIVLDIVDKIGLGNIMQLFCELGLTKNDEVVRKLYRDIGYSLFGYWEIFYWETNNPIAKKYKPNKR